MDSHTLESLDDVSCLNQSDLGSVRAALEEAGWRTLVLDGANVVDKASLLEQVNAELPLPEGLRAHNWDAFADVLWGMLAGIAEDRVALVWTDADVLAGSDLQTLITASIILSNTVDDVIGTEHGFPHAMIFRTLLFGNGDMYHSFKLDK
jgi:Barstar (barnase inhibitor)